MRNEPKWEDYENSCRVKFYELLETVEKSKYSRSQLVTVMVVLDCDTEKATELLDTLYWYGDPDWSEWSWTEFRAHFNDIIEMEKTGERLSHAN